MAVRRCKKLAIAKRREKVADLYLKSWTQYEIAAELSVTQGTICFDLKHVQKKWLESSVRNFDSAREVELRKLDRIEREAWSAWERSQKPAQSARTSGENNPKKTLRHVKNQYGDPRFLDQVNKCITSRRALLGLDAPAKMEIASDGTYTIEERRERLVTVMATIRERGTDTAIGDGRGGEQPRLLCSDGEPGEVEAGPPPDLP